MIKFVTALAAAVAVCACAPAASAQDTQTADKSKPAATAKTTKPAQSTPASKTADKTAKPADKTQKPAGKKAAAAGPQAIAKGEKIFTDQKCTTCHSVGPHGNSKTGAALDDVGSKLSEEDIRQWLLSPKVMAEKTKSTKKPLMPQYTKLTADELDSLVAYLKSLKKK